MERWSGVEHRTLQKRWESHWKMGEWEVDTKVGGFVWNLRGRGNGMV